MARYKNYIQNYGVFYPGQKILLELFSDSKEIIKVSLQKLYWNESLKSICFETIKEYKKIFVFETTIFDIFLDNNAPTGYYLIRFLSQNVNSALELHVNGHKTNPVIFVRPVFTQWSYHVDGFYFSHKPSFVENEVISRINNYLTKNKNPRLLNLLNIMLKKIGLKRYTKSFPANISIDLNSFYVKNKRWSRKIFDENLSKIEGIWFDEIISVFPLVNLLEKNKIEYSVFTDIDLHVSNPELKKSSIIFFSGQEGITKNYFKFINYLSELKIPMILWGTQGFGYRQYEYDENSGILSYLSTRGKYGMWGDKHNEAQPIWKNEGEILGFQFPEPTSVDWRYKHLYSCLNLLKSEHWILNKLQEKKYIYELSHEGNVYPGLTWAGGEIQQKFRKESCVIACLDNDEDIIGIGEYNNFIVISPTYLPAFSIYQFSKHPEVEIIFLNLIKHFIK